MTKRNKIIYWIATIWLALGMLSTGIVQLLKVLKEWAYAGFFFTMSGAIFSHIASGSSISEILPPVLLLALTVISWYYRPVGRKVVLVNQ